MKVTRRQLRQLLSEHMIKPSMPNIPSDDSYTSLNKLARDPSTQHMVDSMGDAFGYPEDRSYVKDLQAYDRVGRDTYVAIAVKPYGEDQEVVSVSISDELIDEIIKAHEEVKELEELVKRLLKPGYPARRYNRVPFDRLRAAAGASLRRIHDQLDDKYGEDGYNVTSYGFEEASGYYADEYDKAMQKAEELF